MSKKNKKSIKEIWASLVELNLWLNNDRDEIMALWKSVDEVNRRLNFFAGGKSTPKEEPEESPMDYLSNRIEELYEYDDPDWTEDFVRGYVRALIAVQNIMDSLDY